MPNYPEIIIVKDIFPVSNIVLNFDLQPEILKLYLVFISNNYIGCLSI